MTEEAPTTRSLSAALLRAQMAIRAVPKSETADVKKNGQTLYSYKFASTEQMIIACRAALHESGLIVRRVAFRLDDGSDSEHGRRPGPPVLYSTFRVQHAESGEHEDTTTPMPIAGTGAADKAMAGALTYAWSYYLRDLLCIARAEDEEHAPDRRGDGGLSFSEPPRSGTKKVTQASKRGEGRKSSSGKSRASAKGEVEKPAEPPFMTATKAAMRVYTDCCKDHGVTPKKFKDFLTEAYRAPLPDRPLESLPMHVWNDCQDLITKEQAALDMPDDEPPEGEGVTSDEFDKGAQRQEEIAV